MLRKLIYGTGFSTFETWRNGIISTHLFSAECLTLNLKKRRCSFLKKWPLAKLFVFSPS